MTRIYDLHCHSTVSDGALAPAQLVERAKRNGVHVLALTDHDETAGIAPARAAAQALDLTLVGGVEVSVTWANQTVHIVGLGVREDDPALVQGLAETRQGRLARARLIAAELEATGIEGVLEGALELAGNVNLISRTHFGRFLVDSGVCGSIPEVFKRYMMPGKPGFVPMRWATLSDAVGWIRGAGGRAVIAHPGRYAYDDTAFDAFYAEFLELGGEGIEVNTGSHTVEQYREYAAVARRFGFLASSGSDFHAPGESRIDLGGLPPLPPDLKTVWHDW